MKVIAALALLSVALASPVALPAPVVLPEPAKPAIETAQFEPIDISPLIVPVEIIQAMQLAEVNPEAVIVVEVAENIEYEPVLSSAVEEEFPAFGLDLVQVAEGLDISEDTAALVEEVAPDAVRFVDNAEDAPLLEEVDGTAVNFVEVAVDNAADVPVAEHVAPVAEEVAPFAEEVAGSPVNFVEVAENIEMAEVVPLDEEVAGTAVNFVEVAVDNADDVPVAEHVAPVAEEVAPFAEEVAGTPVNFVEVAENMEVAEESAVLAEEIPAEAVKVVDFAVLEQAIAEEAAAFASEIGSQVNFVDVAENIEYEESAVPADAVKVVDFAENVESAPVAASDVEAVADAVRVVDAPLVYPAKIYDNAMLR